MKDLSLKTSWLIVFTLTAIQLVGFFSAKFRLIDPPLGDAPAYQPFIEALFRGGLDFSLGGFQGSSFPAVIFHIVYPTNHSFYGLMDNQGWRNMDSWNLSMSGKPAPSLFTSLSFWNFKLAEEKDGWYNAAGSSSGILRAASTTNTSSNIGNEVDLLVRFTQSEKILWEAGYGHFFTGQFINDRVQNQSDSDWAYIMSTVKF
jgi:hypothetical protein